MEEPTRLLFLEPFVVAGPLDQGLGKGLSSSVTGC